MKMTSENNLNKALRESASGEFLHIPTREAEIAYTFSSEFLRKMDKLTKSERSKFWRMTSTAPKKLAAIAASLLLIFLTACSIPSVRASVITFFKETYESFVLFFTGDAGTARILEQYALSSIPEGFSEIEAIEDDTFCIHIYRNDNGDEIILSQSITSDYSIYVDKEQGEITNIVISEVDVSILDSPENNCKGAIWLEDGYAFELTVYGDYDLDFIVQLVLAVERQ